MNAITIKVIVYICLSILTFDRSESAYNKHEARWRPKRHQLPRSTYQDAELDDLYARYMSAIGDNRVRPRYVLDRDTAYGVAKPVTDVGESGQRHRVPTGANRHHLTDLHKEKLLEEFGNTADLKHKLGQASANEQIKKKAAYEKANDQIWRDRSGEERNYQKLKTPVLHSIDERNAHVSNDRTYQFLNRKFAFTDITFIAIVAGCSIASIMSVIGVGYCYYKYQQHTRATADVDYPAYGITGPITKTSPTTTPVSPTGADRKLAQSAQMYHYHHQKQQMITTDKAATSRHTSASDADSDEENEEGDYTVYECPGLASTDEMEVKNPLFQDDLTPAGSPKTPDIGKCDTGHSHK